MLKNIGIFRKIPLKNEVIRTDGTKSSNIAKISNIEVNDNYTKSKKNGYEIIKIGSKDKTFSGEHKYTIKYTYNIGKDPLKNTDEFYYNLIGNEWDAKIDKVTFRIKMPKDFDESLLGFSTGPKGSTKSANVNYEVDNNVIIGAFTEVLYPGDGITVRLTLPDQYFKNTDSNFGINLEFDTIYPFLVIIISLICVLQADRIWHKYGKNDIVEVVTFYPPEGYNSAEIGYLYKGYADNSSVISLLIYLADKGYLKIEENGTKGNRSYKITKLKDYDGNNKCEMIFFNELFVRKIVSNKYLKQRLLKREKETSLKISDDELKKINEVSVTESDLRNDFYLVINRVKETLENEDNQNKVFEKSSKSNNKILKLMSAIIFILITVGLALEYSNDLIPTIVAIIFSIVCGLFNGRFSKELYDGKAKIPKLLSTLFFVICTGFFGIFPVFQYLIQSNMYIIMSIIGIICIITIITFLNYMDKRTEFGAEMLGKIKGFKRFLEIAEKQQLEELVEKNPEYFYDILPYTYALGVSDIWVKQFEKMAIQSQCPKWYDSSDTIQNYNIENFVMKTMKSIENTMNTKPRPIAGTSNNYHSDDSSWSSNSSGGGFSGGGSGGGGGGTW